MNRKYLMAISMIALTGIMPSAFSDTSLAQADTSPAKNAQQNKMTVCNQQASGMKGDERKKFMAGCLKSDSTTNTQQDKMKLCNQAATGKTGDDRKAFMSQCLKKTG